MDIEIGEWLAPGYHLRRAGERSHQLVQRLWNLHNNVRGALHDEWYVTAELDRVAKTLLGMEKNGLALDVVRSEPQRLREIPLSVYLVAQFPIAIRVFSSRDQSRQ